MQLLIAGGTGTAGRVLARRAREAGHAVRVLSRHAPEQTDLDVLVGDLTTGMGLDQAMQGVDAVVDLSNIVSPVARTAAAFFTTATEHLFTAEQRAGVNHHLTLSIVGIDDFPMGYYRAKVQQEQAAVRESTRTGVGCTILRVTQFHDFAQRLFRSYRVGPLVLGPAMHLRPVHLDDVAAEVLEHLGTGPAGRSAPELSGPRPEELPDMLRRYAAATGARRRVVPIPLVGGLRRANEARVLAPEGGHHGGRTFDDWLRELPR
jgi:uncharacterized protein YbjT (DUF2867 family)